MIRGPKIHDARIAAICLHHRVKKLWSADRDFSSFPQLACENPLI
jgi:predicted nucleic acid-binding protein